METFLYLIRHGETDWNRERRIQGHSNIELNEQGRFQAQKLAAYMKSHTYAHVYASDLKRASDTARALAEEKSMPLKALSSLRERCYGDWEGLVYEEIKEKLKDIQPHESLDGIESFHDLQKRAFEQLTELASAHKGETIVAVSHGGFINSFLHFITKGQKGTGVSSIDNTGISLLCYKNQNWNIMEINRVDHLEIKI